MIKKITENYTKILMTAIFSLLLTMISARTNFAQSTDPDRPTVITGNTVSETNTGNLSDDKIYYFAFDVVKGRLEWTLDLTPTNKSDAGGVLQWTLLTPKFQQLKSDNLSAHGSPERQVKELPVTIKRRIILKVVVSGNATYKIKLAGSAVKSGA